MWWAAIIIGSLILAEFYGYWLHVLLHSYWIPSLSKDHMNHHVLSYPPGKSQRSSEYIQKTNGSKLILGLGLEWIIPSIFLLLFTIGLELLIGMNIFQVLVSVTVILVYSIFLFWFLHETLHLKDNKILKIKFLRKWYLNARKMHDIHHHYVDNKGMMNKNYGIAFFAFDRIFGSYLCSMRGKYNKEGLNLAKEKLDKHTNKNTKEDN